MHRSLLFPAVALVLALATPAAAQSDKSPYEVSPITELSLSLGVGLTSVLVPALVFHEDFDEPPCGECDPFSLNRFDRPVTGYWSPAAQRASDVTVGLLMLSPYLLSGLEGVDGEWTKDAVVYTESLAVSLVITQLIKYSVRRARPFTYGDDAPHAKKLRYDSTLSFSSGHSSLAFTAATVAAYTWQLRHPHGSSKYVVWGGTMSLAAATASLRVIGGKHFFSDVLVGSAIGFLVGIVVPSLHRIDRKPRSGGSNASATLTPMGFTLVW